MLLFMSYSKFEFLDNSSDKEFEGLNIARSRKNNLATLSDAPEANSIGNLTEDDNED
jgi:hypothetical protein